MTSIYELTPSHKFPADELVNRLSTEKLHTDNDVHRGSGTIVPEIGPAYKSETDLEQGIEKLPEDNKFEEISSAESQKVGGAGDIQEHEEYRPGVVTRIWRRYRPFGHAIIWLLLTAYILNRGNSNGRWWICGLILHRDEWLIPFLLYFAVTLWLIFRHVPTSVVSKYSLQFNPINGRPLFWMWKNTIARGGNMIPEELQIPLAAFVVVAVILIATFASPTTPDNNLKNRGISIAGLVVFYIVLYATSANRKRIVWRTVLVGLLCQYILALFVLRTRVGYDIFNFISFLARYCSH
jgi:concentrative nucleoside transporter, CNT family